MPEILKVISRAYRMVNGLYKRNHSFRMNIYKYFSFLSDLCMRESGLGTHLQLFSRYWALTT